MEEFYFIDPSVYSTKELEEDNLRRLRGKEDY